MKHIYHVDFDNRDHIASLYVDQQFIENKKIDIYRNEFKNNLDYENAIDNEIDSIFSGVDTIYWI